MIKLRFHACQHAGAILLNNTALSRACAAQGHFPAVLGNSAYFRAAVGDGVPGHCNHLRIFQSSVSCLAREALRINASRVGSASFMAPLLVPAFSHLMHAQEASAPRPPGKRAPCAARDPSGFKSCRRMDAAPRPPRSPVIPHVCIWLHSLLCC